MQKLFILTVILDTQNGVNEYWVFCNLAIFKLELLVPVRVLPIQVTKLDSVHLAEFDAIAYRPIVYFPRTTLSVCRLDASELEWTLTGVKMGA